MKSNKSLLIFIFLFSFLIISNSAFAKVNVVTTLPDLSALVKEVGKDLVNTFALGRPHEDPHHIEPRPTFIRRLAKADLVFLIGMDLEIWLTPLIESSQNLRIQKGRSGYVDCSNVIPVKEVPTTRVDPSQGDVHPYGNPHYWVSPVNALLIVDLIAEKLSMADTENASVYQKNAEEYKAFLRAKMAEWKGKLAGLQQRKIVCLHSSWIYFTDFAGLDIVGYVESRPGIPPTAREISQTVNLMQNEGAKTIVCETYHNKKFPNMIAQKIGGKVLVLPASTGAVKGTERYHEFIEYLVNKLLSELE
ncbi:MAG: zinc ABC transporter substrate-binding protein [Candidatus Riflebacteria bacterium]|nr:zinc ABC transporter substrate-binding protein [Candidatus Riflebacteria bacterium]